MSDTIDHVFDQLAQVFGRLQDEVAERAIKIHLADGAFSVSRYGAASPGASYVATMVVETRPGLRVPFFHRFEAAALDELRLTRDAVASMIQLADAPEIEHRMLVQTVEERFAAARADGIPLSLLSLDARPMEIGDPSAEVRYELTAWMLGPNLDRRPFVMRIADAEDFDECFADEILPEQRARAARSNGLRVPEATND